jgi:polysaccharide deacetylase 2 family uncharacterized protein YibQ
MTSQYRQIIIRFAGMAVGIKLLLVLMLLFSIGYGPLNSRHRQEAVINHQLVTIPLRRDVGAEQKYLENRRAATKKNKENASDIQTQSAAGAASGGAAKESTSASHLLTTEGAMATSSASSLDKPKEVEPKDNQSSIVVAKPAARKQTISIVITGLGLKRAVTELALRMPPEVVLGFSPYGHFTHEFARQARALKHLALVQLPLDTEESAGEDLGPYALQPSLSALEMQQRLDWTSGTAEKYDGAYILGRSQFQSHIEALAPVTEWLKSKHWQVVTDQPVENEVMLQLVKNNIHVSGALLWIDHELSEIGITQQLGQAMELARRMQSVVVLARPYPLTLRMLQAWIDNLSANGIALQSLSQYNTVQNEEKADAVP